MRWCSSLSFILVSIKRRTWVNIGELELKERRVHRGVELCSLGVLQRHMLRPGYRWLNYGSDSIALSLRRTSMTASLHSGKKCFRLTAKLAKCKCQLLGSAGRYQLPSMGRPWGLLGPMKLLGTVALLGSPPGTSCSCQLVARKPKKNYCSYSLDTPPCLP